MNCTQTSRLGADFDPRRRRPDANGIRKNTDDLTALVVDDDPIMLKLAAVMLKNIGFNVDAAGEGTEALFHFNSSPCNLVLTDYEMPAINGYQLGRKIKTLHPGTRVVIMTGLCRAAVTKLMSDGDIDGWLFKPFSLKDLETVLEQVGLPGSVAIVSQSIAQTRMRDL